MSKPAVFLDRDGVLNAVVMRGDVIASPRSVDELKIEPDAAEALARMKAAGFELFVVTNQPDVSRGLMAKETLDAIHRRVRAALPVTEIVACIHDNADGCDCRKPKPGLLLDLARRYDLNLGESWMVGDQDRDIICGIAAGCRTVLMARPYNSNGGADVLAVSLSQAADAIVGAAS